VPGEMEFLYSAYSVFKVLRTDFSAQDWSEPDAHYTVVLEAALDNKKHNEDLPLAPWF
jgi:hypothetical protein